VIVSVDRDETVHPLRRSTEPTVCGPSATLSQS